MECPVALAHMIRLICEHMQFLKTKALAREPVLQGRLDTICFNLSELRQSKVFQLALQIMHFESASDKTVTGTDTGVQIT